MVNEFGAGPGMAWQCVAGLGKGLYSQKERLKMVQVATFVREPHTDADVRLLIERCGNLLPDGRLIAHEFIEQAIRVARDTSHYLTVTKHWRRAVFEEQRVFLDGRSAGGHGFKALTPDDMVRFANREVRAIGRRLKRALIVAATPHDDEILDGNTRLYRARLLSATEQIAQAHGRIVRELSSALTPPRQIRAVVASAERMVAKHESSFEKLAI